MNSIQVSQIVFLASGTIALYILLWRLTHSRSTSVSLDSPQPSSHTIRDGLCQVYPSPESETAADVDTIAIHGLDTDSPRTWTWKHERRKRDVNWLEDSEMLPSRVPKARIFTYNWPADLFESQDYTQKTIEEFARRLLTSIANRREPRPIVFIASCLGGVILMQALHMATDEYRAVGQATSGIIFLATPFRGTSFKDVEWAEPGLKAWASFRNKYISSLLDLVKPNFRLGELLRHFTRFCRDNRLSDNVFTFYETGTTSLPHKISTWLPSQKKPVRVAAQTPLLLWPRLTSAPQLVDQASATLDIVLHPIPLDRPHVKMNKFDGPNDPDYIRVVEKVETVLRNIREGSPSMKAKEYIRINRYSLNHLDIQRLSGELLPINQCYINLGIVERLTERLEKYASFPFSLQTRLNIKPPRKATEITLPTLFHPRKIKDAQVDPKRILIHGRAGVGKTTLCKKIVYEFTYGNLWSDLFECILWVPLRNLKLKERGQSAEYNFRALFRHEYFSQHPDCDELADALWRELREAKGTKMLFLLDGLDEVSRDLEGNMQCFLEELLNQSNVIITARPNTALPKLVKVDLELDTIGFHVDQVNAYIEGTFTADSGKREGIQSFLNCHPLIRGLMRIPIQLDILCYTWNDYRGIQPNRSNTQETMTAIYQRIEKSLWRKDAERLKKWAPSQMPDVHDGDIKKSMDDEMRTLELFAFSGMYNDIIDFEPEHRIIISEHSDPRDKNFLIDRMLGQISFVRSSNASDASQKNYHFLHLTFQEYFGALYFVRQWKAQQWLKCLGFKKNDNRDTAPTEFLRANKHNPSYNIFWRFVAGLLTADRDLRKFYQTLEEEPCDLLGAAYPRLITHCLSETSMEFSQRGCLENQLIRWFLFEWNLTEHSRLTRDTELPVTVIKEAVKQQPLARLILPRMFNYREIMSEERARFLACYIEDDDWLMVSRVLEVLKGHPVVKEHLQAIVTWFASKDREIYDEATEVLKGQTLSEEHHQVILACLEGDRNTRCCATRILQSQKLSEKHLQILLAHFEDEAQHIPLNAARILRSQKLSEEHLQVILPCLQSKRPFVREGAVSALKGQLVSEKHIESVVALLNDKWCEVVVAALKALKYQSLSEKHIQAVIARCKDSDWIVRYLAKKVLRSQPATKGYFHSIVPHLQHRSWQVREVVLEALEGRPVPEKYIQAVIVCLEDENSCIRLAAEKTLQNQLATEENFQHVAPYLQHKSWHVRSAAFRVLGSQLAILKHHIQDILLGLKDEDYHVQLAALGALGHQPNLSKESLKAIVGFLNDDMEVRRQAALETLSNQSVLPEQLCQAIAPNLEHSRGDIRAKAQEVLKNQPALSEELLQAIAPNLEHSNEDIRVRTLKVLEKQPAISKQLLQAIALNLENNNQDIRLYTLRVLRNQPALTEELCQAVALSLRHWMPLVRELALDTLQTQPALLEQFCQGIAARLQDDTFDVCRKAALMLCRQEDLSLIPIESVKPFYITLLKISFERHVTWQEVNNVSRIAIGYEIYECVWPAGFKEALQKAKKEVDAPLYIELQ